MPPFLLDEFLEMAGTMLVKGGGDMGESVVALITDALGISWSDLPAPENVK